MRRRSSIIFLLLGLSVLPLYGHGSLHERIAAATSAIEADPNNPQLLLKRADLLIQHQELKRAEGDLAKVKVMSQDLAERYYLQARLQIARESWQEAKDSLDAYLAAMPKSSDGLQLRSQMYEKLGEGERAIADARMAIACQPQVPADQRMRLIALLQKHGTKEETATAFAETRKQCGPLPALLSTQARWLAETGARDDAAGIYGELRVQVPNLAFTWWAEESLMWRSYDEAKAKEARDRAMQVWLEMSPAMRKRPALAEAYQKFLKQP